MEPNRKLLTDFYDKDPANEINITFNNNLSSAQCA
jgi:hypothetical protein